MEKLRVIRNEEGKMDPYGCPTAIFYGQVVQILIANPDPEDPAGLDGTLTFKFKTKAAGQFLEMSGLFRENPSRITFEIVKG